MIVHVQRTKCNFGAYHVIEYLDIDKNYYIHLYVP